MSTSTHGPRRRPGESRNPLRQPCVYLLASDRNGTIYIGVTSNLTQRVWQHKNDLVEGFTHRHGVHTLVWYEAHDTIGKRDSAGEGHQKMEAGLEEGVDLGDKSRMA